MPKFRVNTALTLNGILRALGVQRAFTGTADFSGITGSSVAVDEVRQKCFVEVSEEGTEAAAVTSYWCDASPTRFSIATWLHPQMVG